MTTFTDFRRADGATDSTADLGATLLRVTLGGLFLAHAGLKLFVFTPAGTQAFFGSLGLPGWLAWVVIAVEVLGGLALIAGIRVRAVSLALVPVLLGAAVLAHGPNGFWFSNPNGGWEYPAFWAIALVVQSLIGPGACAVDRRG